MRPLFDNELAPLTWEVGVLAAPVDEAAHEFVAWETEVVAEAGARAEATPARSDLRGLLCLLSPLTSVLPTRFLLVPTVNEMTAFFDNGWRGPDATFLNFLSRRVGRRGYRAQWVPPGPPAWEEEQRALMFSVFDPEGVADRELAVANDGGSWVFVDHGTPFPFEDTAAYSARHVRDRFTPEHLDVYVHALTGLHVFDESAYAVDGSAFLVTREGGRRIGGMREFDVGGCRPPAA